MTSTPLPPIDACRERVGQVEALDMLREDRREFTAVEEWGQAQITVERAKLMFYSEFVDVKLDVPRRLLSEVHRLYFQLQYEELPISRAHLGSRSRSPIQRNGETGGLFPLTTSSVTCRFPARGLVIASGRL